jgi:hypothetical protein
MAFMKKADAGVVHRNWTTNNWQNFIAHHESGLHLPFNTRTAKSHNANLVSQASEILGEDFDPSKYLLTHATIVASVNTEAPKGVKLGSVVENGQKINRRWADYHVTPDTQHLINNNADCWSRPVLLKSYRTFIGAQNFLEHMQIAELSKGRIIDAVARDVGNSIYVDILVATNLKHAELVKDIEDGTMNSMSMGCSVTYCACTKCGNVAADETEMCAHVKYEKGNVFMDNYGVQRKVAELCGHEELEPTGGVNFIEASWVKTPAFTGAVMRNILQPEVISINTVSKMKDVLSSVPKEWSETDQRKAASFKQALEFPEDPVVESDSDSEEAPKGDADSETDSIQEIENEVEQYILNRIKERLKNKMQQQKQKEVAYGGELEVSNNDTVVRQASHNKRAQTYRTGIATLVHTASNDADLMNRIAQFNEVMNIKVSTDLYRTALKVGSTSKFKSVDKYLLRCAKELGRNPTKGEAKTLVRLGQILAMRK